METKEIIKKIIVKSFCFPFKLTEPGGAILLYHSINSREHQLSIPPEVFEEQILFLKKKNFHFLTLADLSQPEKILTRKTVLLTFDDGLEDNFNIAVPILKKYSVPAVFFIPVNFIGKRFFREEFNCMNWEQIKHLSQDPLFEIGSHGLGHRKFSKLQKEKIEREIKQSKEILERKLQVSIKSFAFPFGKYTKECLAVLKKAGYEFGFTVEPKLLHEDISLLELPRFVINKFSAQFFSDIFKKGYEFYWKVYKKIYRRF